MENLDLKNVKLPLSKKTFETIRNSIRKGRIKWMDMPHKLMYAYQDFWKYKEYQNIE